MSAMTGGQSERSYATITKTHLARLAALALADLESFYVRQPRYAAYRDRLLGVALCQGAALHYLDGQNGVKDFDVWSFFSEIPGNRWPSRRPVANADLGPSEFGRRPSDDPTRFTGRRVDLLGRSVPGVPVGTDPVSAIREWLSRGSSSPRKLRRKAVILIDPAALRGTVVWPTTS